MSTPKLLIIGHRGAKGLAPENSVHGLQAALRHEVDEIEIDVRITKDSIAILSHDPHTHNAVGDRLSVHEHTYHELHRFNPDICTLEGALTYIDTKAKVVIEVKPREAIEPVVRVIQEFLDSGMYSPRDISLASFSQKTLIALHKALPDCPTIVNEKWSGVRAHWRANQLGTRRVTMRSWWLWKGFITPVARRGWQLSAYTVNDPALAKRWQRYGLYGIVTDYPDRFQ